MVSVLNRKLVRELRSMAGTLLAVAGIIVVGVILVSVVNVRATANSEAYGEVTFLGGVVADHEQPGHRHAVLEELAQHDLPHRPGLEVLLANGFGAFGDRGRRDRVTHE